MPLVMFLGEINTSTIPLSFAIHLIEKFSCCWKFFRGQSFFELINGRLFF